MCHLCAGLVEAQYHGFPIATNKTYPTSESDLPILDVILKASADKVFFDHEAPKNAGSGWNRIESEQKLLELWRNLRSKSANKMRTLRKCHES